MRVCAFSHSVSLSDTLRTVGRHVSPRGGGGGGGGRAARHVTVNYRYDDDDDDGYAAKRTYNIRYVYAVSYETVRLPLAFSFTVFAFFSTSFGRRPKSLLYAKTKKKRKLRFFFFCSSHLPKSSRSLAR